MLKDKDFYVKAITNLLKQLDADTVHAVYNVIYSIISKS